MQFRLGDGLPLADALNACIQPGYLQMRFRPIRNPTMFTTRVESSAGNNSIGALTSKAGTVSDSRLLSIFDNVSAKQNNRWRSDLCVLSLGISVFRGASESGTEGTGTSS